MFLNDLNLVNHLTVSLFRADIINGEIIDCKLPEDIPSNSYIFSCNDLEKNEIDIQGKKIPILCDTTVSGESKNLLN